MITASRGSEDIWFKNTDCDHNQYMKEFPKVLCVDRKSLFGKLHDKRVLCYLRTELYEHIISKDENNYFDLGSFTAKHYSSERSSKSSEMFVQMKSELSEIGWKCKTSFGGTGMFIYSSKDPPPLCYEDGL
jgi:hypothetical protein